MRPFAEMNMAFMCKWRWSLLLGSDALWAQVTPEKYFRGESFRTASSKVSDSSFWKDIIKNKEMDFRGACKLVGNGETTNFWQDPLVPSATNFRPKPISDVACGYYMMSELFLADNT